MVHVDIVAGKNWYLFRTLVLNNILLKIKTDVFHFSPFTGSPGINITRSGPEEIAANALSNITLSCLVPKAAAELDELRVTWNFKNQRDPLNTGGKYRIPALEPISYCRRAFKLEIIRVTADDEGVYTCHQSCKYGVTDDCKSSAKLELKVYSAPPPTKHTTPTTRSKRILNDFQLFHISNVKDKLSIIRNFKRNFLRKEIRIEKVTNLV